ncbi:hypothetical protein [Pseudomonas synxantha]|uniref:Uncharacterized protein n=1 Tax=Pseudomonas synxantha TaxID=47883 RepID=A0AAU8TS96_9PSED|nr:hypothetical protein [Pseudomonas synxantha]AKA80812.1 hypothetical protein VO64_0266 [Pseudomonas synxantha]
MNDLFEQLLGSSLFEPRQRHHMPLKSYMDLAIKRMHAIFDTGLINNELWLGQPRQSEFSGKAILQCAHALAKHFGGGTPPGPNPA